MIESLVDAVRNRRALLFVGAGVSQGLGLPTWNQLIDYMAQDLGYDPTVFSQNGTFPELAEYYEAQKTSLGPFHSWMDRRWHEDEARVDSSLVHQAIVDLGFPVIYTTNYDRWLEIAHERREAPFTKIANVGDFTSTRDGVTQIVKLHGDFDADESLVLTETSYFERFAFESPLDIKLRADAIGRTILFVGYSLSDVNIRYLLYKLHRLWADSSFAGARPQSYIFLTRPNPVQETILARRGIVPIVADVDDPGFALRQFLETLRDVVRGVVT
jgi:NAD-dependent SIR2 family protein deacetylase